MKQSDVKYYNEQINSFTQCKAIEKKNGITVYFPSGRKVTAITEEQADNLLSACGNIPPNEM